MAGEPVDLLVNGTPIARGEVVVIDEQFGVRITDVLGAQPGAAPLSRAAARSRSSRGRLARAPPASAPNQSDEPAYAAKRCRWRKLAS